MSLSNSAVVVNKLREAHLRCAFAESLTGGMISSGIVDIAGASDVFDGAVVSYTDQVKINVLGVPSDVILEHTAVSSECAQAMAIGVRRLIGSDIALSATGYAGSSENSSESDDDGLVYIGFAAEDEVCSYECRFKGGRTDVRRQSAEYAYNMILEYLKEHE